MLINHQPLLKLQALQFVINLCSEKIDYPVMSDERADDMGNGDLYISRKDKAGNWLPAKHLGNGINTSSLDYCPYVTADRKYLIFTSNRLLKEWHSVKAINFAGLTNLLSEPGNGQGDLYWVKFNIADY